MAIVPESGVLDYFLTLDGVSGDASDKSYSGWLNVRDYSFVVYDSSGSQLGGGAGAGQTALSPIRVTVASDTALASLMKATATGELFPNASLVARSAGTTPIEVYDLDLADVMITNIEEADGGGYTLTLDYAAIDLTTRGTDGKQTGDGFQWNVSDNTVGEALPGASPPSKVSSTLPTRYFMLVDGVYGGSTDKAHQGWFDLSSFDIDFGNSGSIMAGSGAGEPTFSPLAVKLGHDTGLTELLLDVAQGTSIKGVRIEGVRGEELPTAVYDLTLQDVIVTQVTDASGPGYDLEFDYSKIELTTHGMDAKGNVTKTGSFGFDLAANESYNPDDPTPVNDAPAATNLSAAEAFTEDTALDLTDIVISDVDSATVTATLTVSNPAAGSLSTATSGTVTATYNAGLWSVSGALAEVNALLADVTFTPAANFNGSFTIATSVSDGIAAPVTGTKLVTGTPVNDAPNAVDDTNGVDEDQNVSGNVITGPGTDSDLDGDAIRVSFVAHGATSVSVSGATPATIAGTWGTLTLRLDGSYTYSADNDQTDIQPAGPQTDTFNYTISDGNGGTDTATLTITVNALDDTATQTGTVRADTLNGDAARAGIEDTISGGTGKDRIGGRAGADTLLGDAGDDFIWGGDGIDKLFGEEGNDQLSGGNGRDTLVGDLGDDKLYGDGGDDILVGGQRNDLMNGGAGNDVFVFLPGRSKTVERDTIAGFDLGGDILSLQGGVTITSQTQVSGSTVLGLSSGGFITLQGITLADWTTQGADNLQLLPTVELFV